MSKHYYDNENLHNLMTYEQILYRDGTNGRTWCISTFHWYL